MPRPQPTGTYLRRSGNRQYDAAAAYRVARPFMNDAAPTARLSFRAAAKSEHRQRRLVERRALLAQREDLIFPVLALREPRKRPRESGILPPPRDPRAVVDHPQRAQRLDEVELPVIEVAELRVPLEQVLELHAHLVATAGQEQPQILHRGPVHAVVEIDEVGACVRPEHVAGMAVAVDPKHRVLAGGRELAVDRVEHVRRDAAVAVDEMGGNEAARLARLDRLAAERVRRQHRAVTKAARRTERVDAADDPAHVHALLGRRELGPPPAAPLEQREAITRVLVQRLAAEHERRHDRHVALREVERELVLLEDRVVRPAPGAIELRHHEAVADTDLIHAVLVARERDDAAVAFEADALHRLENEVRAQPCIGQLSIHSASSPLARPVRGMRSLHTFCYLLGKPSFSACPRAQLYTARLPGCRSGATVI